MTACPKCKAALEQLEEGPFCGPCNCLFERVPTPRLLDPPEPRRRKDIDE